MASKKKGSGLERSAASVGGGGDWAQQPEAAPIETWQSKRGRVDLACLRIVVVSRAKVAANNYNPNSVPTEKMRLLAQSIADNGFCFPIVVTYDEALDLYVIVDGFHRFIMCQPEWLDIENVPVLVLSRPMADRLAATWQFNKARGHHQVDLDAELIRALLQQGLSEAMVAGRLGIDLDTVHRYKQITGVAELFAGSRYSTAWSMEDDGDDATSRNPTEGARV